MIKKLTILTAIIIFSFSSLLAEAKLEILNESFNFGVIPQHSSLSYNFWLKSTGTDTLHITEIKTGCKCVIIPLESEFIPPGDSQFVELQWAISNEIFSVGKHPYIFTNASEDPYRLHLIGQVAKNLDSLKPVTSIPYRFIFSSMKDKSIDEIKFSFTNRTRDDIEIYNLSYPSDYYELSFPASIPASSKADGTIKVNPDFIDKEFKGSITFLVKSEEHEKRFTIPYERKIYK